VVAALVELKGISRADVLRPQKAHMIPNIFVGSTIDDLRYLRDAVRDAIVELAYNPIMSEYGEVGYISPTSAIESCYRTVRQCQLAILIIGKRYGSVDKDGFSVTHREFLTAKENRIPTIAFVESKVLHHKEVYDVEPNAPIWNNFPRMDYPHKTFALIDEVRNSEIFNGLIPITTAGEMKQLVKVQIADFVGEKLSDIVRPIKSEVQEVLAELKTLRQEIAPSKESKAKTDLYLRTMRFLLDDKRADFRKFCEVIAGDLDAAVPRLIQEPDLDKFAASMGYKIVVEDNKENFDKIMRTARHPAAGDPRESFALRFASSSVVGWWAAFDNSQVVLSSRQLERFRATYAALQGNLALS
jgi:hypothetical protein